MTIHIGGKALELRPGVVVGCAGQGARELVQGANARYIGPFEPVDIGQEEAIAVDFALDLLTDWERQIAEQRIEAARRRGATVLIASNDWELLRTVCDELWWVDGAAVRSTGHPNEVLDQIRREQAAQYRNAATTVFPAGLRRGDGRAQLVSVETLDASGTPAGTWRSGEAAGVQVTVLFQAPVEDPVVGIMIRTRIGMEVYGTNTELEGLALGPRKAGDTLRVDFTFQCDLCPQHYTITAASHDPDGVWHDWVEDAVAVSVSDTRYTAGVANLRARVDFCLTGP